MSQNIHIKTDLGKYLWGDSLSLMQDIPDGTVDAIICSPPFEGDSIIKDDNREGKEFVNWFKQFFSEFERLLTAQGVVAFELGGLWLEDAPGKSIQQASFLQHLISNDWKLIQEFFYFNPQLLRPQPGIGAPRLADSVTPIWLVSKSYSVHFEPAVSEREPYSHFVRGNLFEFDTSDKHDQQYERLLASKGENAYVDRWPSIVPAFLIELLTTPGQTILDPFAGSGATCHAANRLGRQWVGIECDTGLSQHIEAMFTEETCAT